MKILNLSAAVALALTLSACNNDAKDTANTAVNTTKEVAKDAKEATKGAVETASNEVKKVAEEVKQEAKNVAQAVEDNVSKAADNAKEAVKESTNEVKEKVFAVVNGINITEFDVAPLLNGIPVDSFAKMPEDTKKHLLNRAIELRLLTEEAKKSDVATDPDYQKALEKAKDQIALNIYEKREFNKITVSDKEIGDFYTANKDKFFEPAQMKASHILVKDEASAKAIIKELSALKGDALAKKFVETAKTKSIEPIASQSGGELGWFAEEQMVEPFAKATKNLKKGELSKTPVKTQYGYHVILKEDSKDKRQLSQDEVKGYIEANLKNEKFQQQVSKRAEELRTKAAVEYK